MNFEKFETDFDWFVYEVMLTANPNGPIGKAITAYNTFTDDEKVNFKTKAFNNASNCASMYECIIKTMESMH